ncbi:uncharacterized protein [Epargyreus clarus]|uniref:uncharacterized protein n=1 Tax=Epargyreus clarus TaxID=520877 RepID=UPI003C2E26AF
MPKRKRSDTDSLDYIKKKIKKLERKLLKGKRRRRNSSSTDSSQLSNNLQDDIIIESDSVENSMVETNEPGPSTRSDYQHSLEPTIEDGTVPQPEVPIQALDGSNTDVDKGAHTPIQELDDATLDILGADPLATKAFGKDIQKDVAVRFEFITTSGLNKDVRKELLESYLPPTNCRLIDAPSLNPEIKAAITEIVLKRDKAMQGKQKQISCAISSLSEAITHVLSKEPKDQIILKLLMDTGRILCDAQHNESVTRRNFILASLKKELKDQLQLTKIEDLLFGKDLSETLKAAKAINKSGAELKTTAPTKVSANKLKSAPSTRNLNWRAPPANRRPTGTPRAKEPAPPKHQHTTSYRGSRPSTSRGRR